MIKTHFEKKNWPKSRLFGPLWWMKSGQNYFLSCVKSLWVKSLHKICEKPTKSQKFLLRVLKIFTMGRFLRNGPNDFFLICIFVMWEGSLTTPNQEIS